VFCDIANPRGRTTGDDDQSFIRPQGKGGIIQKFVVCGKDRTGKPFPGS